MPREVTTKGSRVTGSPPAGWPILWERSLDDYVTFIQKSPMDDSLLIGSLSGQSEIIDPATGGILHDLANHDLGALAGGWSHTGAHVATAGQDSFLQISSFGAETQSIRVRLNGWSGTLSWSPNYDTLAVASGRSLMVLNPSGEIIATWEDLPSTISAIAWSVDGVSVGAACYGGLHWFRPGEPDRSPKHFSWKGSLLDLQVSPDGKWASSGCQDASVHIWRLWSGDDLQMSGYPSKIEHTAWDPSSRFLAVGGVGDVTIWDFSGRGPQGSRPITLEGFDRHVSALAYSPSGDMLAACDSSGMLIIWTTGKRPVKRSEFSFEAGISTVVWSTDGQIIFAGYADGTVRALSVSNQ
jgi:WD40 repeat protein